MGTLSLIFGILGIGIGIAFGIYTLVWTTFYTSDFFIYISIAAVAGAVGLGLVLKYNNDKTWS